ncbi:MAG: hypothetical protein KC620_07685 [Myxococcales bacterium]|nr:hypothetical protein [Myxococcales bacterium]
MRRSARQSDRLALFFGFTVALAASAIFLGDLLGAVANEVETVAIAVALAVVALAALALALYALRGPIFRLLRLPRPGTFGDVVHKGQAALTAWEAGQRRDALERVLEGGASLVSYVTWSRVRGWMLATLVSTASIFALLIGEVLLLRQNRLIEEQNQFLRDQNRGMQAQLTLAREHIRAPGAKWRDARCPDGAAAHPETGCTR